MKKLSLICFGICIILLLFMVKIAFSAIDVGAEASDRGSSGGDNYTDISVENPANESGTIDHIEYFGDRDGTITVASFEHLGSNVFTARANSGELSVTTGFNEFDAPGDFTAFAIESGDYIGVFSVGSLRHDQDTSGDGKWYKYGDQTSCESATFTLLGSRTISLWGEGGAAAPPPTEEGQSQIMIWSE